jgi:hypothetical protein
MIFMASPAIIGAAAMSIPFLAVPGPRLVVGWGRPQFRVADGCRPHGWDAARDRD